MRDHKKMYPIYLRVSILSSIAIIIALFVLVPYSSPTPYTRMPGDTLISIPNEFLQQINRYQEPPKLDRPKVAIIAESEAADEAVETIASTELTERLINITPTGPDIEIVPYYRLEVKPTLVNNPVPIYPELAKKAGIEGTTSLQMLVDIDGSVTQVKILKSSGNQMLDAAAVAAARASRFTPAKQRDRFVRVWMSRRFEFRLTNS